jgi:hypothetical protein
VTRAQFFHQVANLNKRNNSAESLMVNGTASTDHFEISENIVQFYNNLYAKQFSWRPNLDDLSFDSCGVVLVVIFHLVSWTKVYSLIC